MPIATTVRFQRHLPTVQDFLAHFPQYTTITKAESFLWSVIVTGENAVAAEVATRLGLPAVSAGGDQVGAACAARNRELTGYVKQLSGAVVWSLMTANGYQPTGNKRAVSRPGWNRGEVYRP